MIVNASDLLTSIIIVNFNGRHLLDECLRSVLSQTGLRFEVILVDNGSSDGSVEFVKQRFGSVRVIESGRNLGFAGGNNLGVRNAQGDLVVLLNNDTVVHPGWLCGLVKAVAPPEVAIASSLVRTEGIPEKYYDMNGSLNFTGHNIMRIFQKPENICYAGGASLIFKKNILGIPFDDDYFAYAEDVYLSFRARRMGYRVVHTNASVLEHRGGATTGSLRSVKLRMLQERNRLLTMFLFLSGRTILKASPYFMANFIVKSASALVSARFSLRATMWAHGWLLVHAPAIVRKRRALLPASRGDDDDVVTWMTGRITQGENTWGRVLNGIALAYCRLVGLKTIESLPMGTR